VVPDPPTGPTVTVVFDQAGDVTISASNGCCSVQIGVNVREVVLAPDPDTHVEDEIDLMILPGDVERAIFDPPQYEGDVVFTIVDSDIAKFRDGEMLTDSLQFSTPPDSVEVVGVGVGETEIAIDFPSEPSLDVCPLVVKVGGTVRLQFDHLPRFMPYGGPPPTTEVAGPQAEPENDSDWIEIGGASFGQPGGRELTRQEIIDILQGQDPSIHSEVFIAVSVWDAEGNPKRGKRIGFAYQKEDELTWIGGASDIATYTDENGEAQWNWNHAHVLTPNELPPITQSVTKKGFAVIVGEAARRFFDENDVPNDVLNDLLDNGDWELHLGESLYVERVFEDSQGDVYNTTLALHLPWVNHIHAEVVKHHLAEPQWDDGLDLTGGVEVEEPDGSTTQVQFGPMTRPLQDENAAQELSDKFFDMLLNSSWSGGHWIDDREGGFTPIVSINTITDSFAFELTISLLPFGDLYDMGKELIEHAINGEPINKPLMAVCAVGLAFDAGYVAPPIGIAGNFAIAVIKRLLKSVPPSMVNKIARLGDDMIDGVYVLVDYVIKVAVHSDEPLQAAGILTRRFERIAYESQLTIGEDALLDSVRVVAHHSINDVGDVASEGFAAFVKYGDEGVDSFDDLLVKLDGLGDEVGGESARGIGEAIEKTYKNAPNGVNNPKNLQRVDEAVGAAARQYDSHLRGLVTPHIGPDKAFKSMEEFEAMRFMRAEDLRPDQVAAINAIRDSVIDLGSNTEVAKAVSLSQAMARLQNGNPNLTGFFTRKQDLAGANSAGEMIARVRPEYSGSPFFEGEAFAVIETKGVAIANNATVPRSSGFGGSVVEEYPYVGNGFAASLDGHLTPEWKLNGATVMESDVTVMAFRNADGSPQTVQIGELSGDKWVLRANGNAFFWEPLSN